MVEVKEMDLLLVLTGISGSRLVVVVKALYKFLTLEFTSYNTFYKVLLFSDV